MSRYNSKHTATGKARTEGDRHPYLRIVHWANPENWFWETDSHTERSKQYFRANLAKRLSNRHNQVRIDNANNKA